MTVGMEVLKGSTNISVTIRIIDSTDGTPETGVVAATAGLVLQYRRELSANVSLATLTDLALLTTAHTDKGMLHIGNGYYRVDVPDAAFASGARDVLVHGVATGMVVIGSYVSLVDFDSQDGTRLGLTALPNAAADAAGGLPISDAGGLDMDAIKTDTAAILVDTGTTLDGKIDTIDGIVDSILLDTAEIGTAGAGLTDLGGMSTAMKAEVNAEADTAITDAALATAANLATVDTNVDAILVDTAEIGAAGAGLTAVPWNAAWDAEVESECNDALVALGLDHFVGAAVTGTDVVDNSIAARLVSASATADWDDFVNTTDSLQAIRDRGDAAWTTGAGGTPPDLLQNTTITGLSSQTVFNLTAGSADDDAYNGATAIITDSVTSEQKAVMDIADYAGATKTVTLTSDPGIFTMANGDTIDIVAAPPASSAPSAATVADAVWDEALSGHVGAGSAGKSLADTETDAAAILVDTAEIGAAGAGLTALATAAALATVDTNVDSILVDTAEIGAAGAGLTALATAAAVATVDTNVDAILVDTGTTLPATLTTIEGKVDTVDTNVDSILVDTAEIGTAGAGLTDLGGMSTAMKAEVNAEADTAITDAGLSTAANLATVDTVVDGIATTLGTAGDGLTGLPISPANVTQLNGAAGAAAQLALSADTVVNGTASGTPTTTTMVSDIGITADDQLNGRTVIFADDTTTAALRDQATDITGCTASSNTLTFTALTNAPVSGDTFVIL